MPRIELRDAYGTSYRIDTRNIETTLPAWFDEILPRLVEDFRGTTYWPAIQVTPLCWRPDGSDADWPMHARHIFIRYEFKARNGLEAMTELIKMRGEIEAKIAAESSQ